MQGVAGDLQLVQWSRSALKDSGASRKVSTALINALDRLRSVAWDPRAVATAADTLHALPSYQCAKVRSLTRTPPHSPRHGQIQSRKW